jgi:DHA1 family bicyclomycin/chloramphenicol resistance-like MFS transporter
MYYALHQGVIIAVFSFFSLYCNLIHNFFGVRNSVIYGSMLILIGALMLVTVSVLCPLSPDLTSMSMIIYGTGSAIIYPIIFARSLDIFPDIKGTASSAIMSVRALLCAGFIALSSYLYQGALFTVALMVLLAAISTFILTRKLLGLILFDIK